MFASRLVGLSSVGYVNVVNKAPVLLHSGSGKQLPCLVFRTQKLASQSGRTTLRGFRQTKTPNAKEAIQGAILAPAGEKAFTIGRGVLAGASAVGLGALCYYGLGMSSEMGAIDKAALWPDIVRHRIRDTYMYFGGSLVFTAASAVAIARNPTALRLVSQGGWKSLIATIAAMWGSGILCQSLPYKQGIGAKQAAWMLHASVVGAVIAPLTLLGGPLMLRAACYTAGVVGGLSTLAVCAPSEKFLNMGGPLAMGLGVVIVSSIGTMFLPPTTALGAGMYSIAMYGGLVLFSMFLLYDTQKVIKRAETHPAYNTQPFDPVNNSVGIYLDTINIFIRIAMMLAGGGNRRK